MNGTLGPLALYAAALEARRQAQLERRVRVVDSPQSSQLIVNGAKRLAFCSNDYLGLADAPELIAAAQRAVQRWGVGAAASHLISGHMTPHESLERRLAEFVRLPAALIFSTGYMANVGVISALADRASEIFADRLNHASLNDGAILSRARLRRYRHKDLAQLEQWLADSRTTRKLIVTDTVFSMDGDIADVHALHALAERYDALLMLDDAHGFGVLGPQGRGALVQAALESPRVIYMATFGKALGVTGAFVAADAVIIDTVRQLARSYVYSTAMPPGPAATIEASIDLAEHADARREKLAASIARLRAGLKLKRWRLAASHTAIQPVIVGDSESALAAAARLDAEGIWVPAIRPPTVPQGTARLRISLSAAHTPDDVDRLIDALQRAEQA